MKQTLIISSLKKFNMYQDNSFKQIVQNEIKSRAVKWYCEQNGPSDFQLLPLMNNILKLWIYSTAIFSKSSYKKNVCMNWWFQLQVLNFTWDIEFMSRGKIFFCCLTKYSTEIPRVWWWTLNFGIFSNLPVYVVILSLQLRKKKHWLIWIEMHKMYSLNSVPYEVAIAWDNFCYNVTWIKSLYMYMCTDICTYICICSNLCKWYVYINILLVYIIYMYINILLVYIYSIYYIYKIWKEKPQLTDYFWEVRIKVIFFFILYNIHLTFNNP